MNSKLTALLVDDEEKAVSLLKKLLEDTQHFSEIRSANSSQKAFLELKKFSPDIIFLDIKMPGKDGFQLLEDIHAEKINSEVIFVTAYDSYALQAIKTHAFDYLLKPVDRAELLKSITQFMERKQKPDYLNRIEKFLQAQKDTTKLRINTRTGYLFIDPHSILYCQADGNYTTIHLGDRQHICSMQLGMVENLLPQNGFMRLGRSLIINFNYITSVDRKTNSVVFEKDSKPHTLHVSKSQLKELEEKQDQ